MAFATASEKQVCEGVLKKHKISSYDEKTGKDLRGLAQIIVAKHRNGATDSIWLRFRGKYAKFQNEGETIDDDEMAPPIPVDTENGMSIQSKMNSNMGINSFGPQISPDGFNTNINILGEDINSQF